MLDGVLACCMQLLVSVSPSLIATAHWWLWARVAVIPTYRYVLQLDIRIIGVI